MVAVTHAGKDRLRIDIRGHQVFADQPVVDGGEDSAPTPTELFVASLAACVAFYAERFLRRRRVSTEGLRVTCDYWWAEDPHRVGAVSLTVHAPLLPAQLQPAFERVIDHCSVHNTLRVPPQVDVRVVGAGVAVA